MGDEALPHACASWKSACARQENVDPALPTYCWAHTFNGFRERNRKLLEASQMNLMDLPAVAYNVTQAGRVDRVS